MKTLVFNAPALRYEVPAQPFSDLDKERVCLITDFNKIQVALTGKIVTPRQFNELWDTPLDLLQNYVLDQHTILNTARYKATI